ncbi:MAG TPA: hypothetical protein VLI41_07100 [Phenylobacterium sp.]|uniref:hypothetical protein n=1 Tax=Phenylobacterium sp. TaxID=1871053 RepID=UPI002C58D06F|nr:hypothetical protein [Phenylobacterium sp.]HSV02959.1 hypothetical protein [Phenylobacterium sp.]
MKAQLLMLGAAALLAASTPALGLDRAVQSFIDHAQAAADAKLTAAGLAPSGDTKVRGTISADGLITGLHVVGSSGSHDSDYAVEQALRRLNVGEPPTGLIGAQLTLDLAPAGLQASHAR